MSRRRTREKALQGLYQLDMTQCSIAEAVETVTDEPGDVDRAFLEQLIRGTVENITQIDEMIARFSQGWEISRMASVDRNVLRLAVYELLFDSETPVNVVVNEAVELAKQFSTPESGKFVNGILGKMLPEVDQLRQGVKFE